MIDISGHLRTIRRETGFQDLTQPVLINCCGYQTFKTRNFSKSRPKGREDYQIIYIFKGQGTYFIDGKKQVLPAGSIILYLPDEPQFYSYYFKDVPEIYWIHFTGSAIPDILERFDIKTGYIGESIQIKNLFHETILELQLKKMCFESVALANFEKMLALICRTKAGQNVPPDRFQLDRLVIQLNQNYGKTWSVKSMADYCGLSPSYFAHAFKKTMKVSPIQYLTDLRIDKAKDLLLCEGLSIAALADLLGYGDPLYFSRIFKKSTGLSPRSYQKNHLLAGEQKSASHIPAVNTVVSKAFVPRA